MRLNVLDTPRDEWALATPTAGTAPLRSGWH